MSTPVVLTVTRDFDATPEQVFDAWLDPARAGRFLFATPEGEMLKVEIDARVGGRALVVERRAGGVAHHHLQFEVVDRPHRLVFLFRADSAEEGEWTRVSIAIAARGSGATLTLTHEMDPAWAAYEQQTRKGWTMILDSLSRIADRTDRAVQTAPDTIRLERLLDAPIDRVWSFLVDSDKRAKWFAAGPLEQRPAGALTFTFDHDALSSRDVPCPERFAGTRGRVAEGYVEAIDPPRLLAFHWGGGEDIARFELTPEGERTRLVITHSRLSTRTNRVLVASGWDSHTQVLAKILAGSACEDFWAVFEEAFQLYDAALPHEPAHG